MDMSRGVAHKLTCFGRHPGEKVFQPGGTVSDSPGRPSYEFDSTPRPAVGAAIEGVAMELSTKLDCVVTAGIRHVIYKLIPVVRALYLGPVKSAQFLREDVKRKNVDARQSAIQRISHAGVEPI